MAPARPLKRQKTNPSEVPQSSQVNAAQVPLPPDTPPAATVLTSTDPITSKADARSVSLFVFPLQHLDSTNDIAVLLQPDMASKGRPVNRCCSRECRVR